MPIIDIDTGCMPHVHIYMWQITETPEELARLITGGNELLCEATRLFGSPKRRCEWMATRVLLQHTPHNGAGILYHANGAPYLADSNKHISISHTTGYAAIAIAGSPVGLDIELPTRNAMRAAEAFLQPQEIEQLNQHREPAAEALRLWTAKEAAFKLAPQRSTVLKDILATPAKESIPGRYTYDIAYRCGHTARCTTTAIQGLMVSCCTE